ncbi:extracellular solute-binding protein [Paenibacillus glycanilyticus]|uniref:extracellular solute-binding protein n=1 Tax=Paenibacillus glycanilyticus TaxID=126569 RepID=UPI00203CEE15|nr:extracellular solute-binding protein [Paenibacillus glycanilyticus]MCM3626278.1 extracellular solute-binding protein [Paenibacillus glycanilyticus]
MKRSMKIGAALLLAGTMVACSNNGNVNDANSGQEQTSNLEKAIQAVVTDKKEVSISFWTGTGANNFPFMESMVKDFQTKYPNIKVEFSNQGRIDELTKKLTQNIVSKSTPTLSNLDASSFPEYINSDAIVDLLPYYNNSSIGFTNEEQGNFYQNYINEAKSFGPEGTMYGFPTNKKTTDVLVYNKTFFDKKGWKAPQTWDEVARYSQIIKEETGKPGFSFDNSYGDAAFKLMSQQWGSPYIAADGTIDINNEGTKEAMKFYKENMDKGTFTMPALMPSAGGKNSSDGFVMEETYMFVGAAAGVTFAIPNPASGHKDFEIGVAPVPQKDLAKPIALSKGEDYAIFSNATDEERVAAWLLIKFMSDPEENANWLVNTGNLPISKAMLDVPTYKQFLDSDKTNPKSYYMAAAVNAAISNDYMTYNKVTVKSGSLSTETGNLWEATMIGGGDIDALLPQTAEKLK